MLEKTFLLYQYTLVLEVILAAFLSGRLLYIERMQRRFPSLSSIFTYVSAAGLILFALYIVLFFDTNGEAERSALCIMAISLLNVHILRCYFMLKRLRGQ